MLSDDGKCRKGKSEDVCWEYMAPTKTTHKSLERTASRPPDLRHNPTNETMLLKQAIVLLSCFPPVGADLLDERTNYLRKLKKERAGKDDQGVITSEMLRTFDMGENRLGLGDWIGFVYNNTANVESVELEAADESERIDLDNPHVSDEIVYFASSDESQNSSAAQPFTTPEIVVPVLDSDIEPDISSESIAVDSATVAVNSAQDEEDWNHGATAVSATKSGIITFKISDTTHVGDTLFLFLRCVCIRH